MAVTVAGSGKRADVAADGVRAEGRAIIANPANQAAPVRRVYSRQRQIARGLQSGMRENGSLPGYGAKPRIASITGPENAGK
ncbi:MAG: hypothetical protein OXU22_02205 [Gammaproteobacteria bacterium]|nr:hypothetical protein [Gammaproteobacteria bacterium]